MIDFIRGVTILNYTKNLTMKEYSVREVFFICVIFILISYIVLNYFDSDKSNCIDTRIKNVEVTLDKVIDEMNKDYLNKQDEVKHVPTKQTHKFTSIRNFGEKISLNKKEFDCLARNIYWESMHEPLIGQLAVANVTYNRVLSGKWGNTFCKVIYAKKQFSWTNFEHIKNSIPKNKIQWKRAKHSAFLFTNGSRVTNLNKTQFYYANYIKRPVWSKKMKKDAEIGKHIFYTSAE